MMRAIERIATEELEGALEESACSSEGEREGCRAGNACLDVIKCESKRAQAHRTTAAVLLISLVSTRREQALHLANHCTCEQCCDKKLSSSRDARDSKECSC